MLSQKEHDLKRANLINGGVRAVAEYGLENTSTRLISELAGSNEAYIYRYFNSKEDLLAQAFAEGDTRFLNVILKNFPVLHYNSIDYESRCNLLFQRCWNYIMSCPERVIFYIRYYYSSSFQKYAYADHMERYAVLIEKMRSAFPEAVDVGAILHYVLDALLGLAMHQISNPQPDPEQVAKRNFQMLFSVVRTYIKPEKIIRPWEEKQ